MNRFTHLTVKKVAMQDTATLLLGESGTGKELIARAIHDMSTRAGQALIGVGITSLSCWIATAFRSDRQTRSGAGRKPSISVGTMTTCTS